MEKGYIFDVLEMRDRLIGILARSASPGLSDWLTKEQVKWTADHDRNQFIRVFASIPRKSGYAGVNITKEEGGIISDIRQNFSVLNWTIDRLARAWWLIQLPCIPKDSYLEFLDSLFLGADMMELAALYGSLPLFAFPENLVFRTTEGIRTNMTLVLDAIALDNPYPSEYLPELAWNQLVLKVIFTGRPLWRIQGLQDRSNPELSRMLSDYIRERWSAGRNLDPYVWSLMGPYLGLDNFPLVERLIQNPDPRQQKAAFLCCASSSFPPASRLLDRYPILKKEWELGILAWDQFTDQT